MKARRFGFLGVCASALMMLTGAPAASAAMVELAPPKFSAFEVFTATPRVLAVGQADAASTPLDLFTGYGQFGSSTLKVSITGLPGNWGCCLIGNSTQTITSGAAPNEVELADINADGNLDVALAHDNGVSFSPGAASGSYGAFVTPGGVTVAPTSGIALARLSAAPRPHMVAVTGSFVDVYANTNGNPPYNTRTQYATDAGLVDVATGDLDGDGDQDIATASASTQRAIVLINDGTGAFSPVDVRSIGLFTRPGAIAVANVSGDGRAELIVTEPDRGTVAVISTASLPVSLGPAPPIETGFSPLDVATGDLDGDGRSEIVTVNAGSETVTVSEVGVTSKSFPAGPVPTAVAVADATGDGRPDVVVASEPLRKAPVLANLGVPAVPSTSVSTPSSNPASGGGSSATSAAAPSRSAKLACTVKRRGNTATGVACTATLSDLAAAKSLKATLLRKGSKRALATATAKPGGKLLLAPKTALTPGSYVVKLSVGNSDGTTLATERAVRVKPKLKA